MKKFYCECSEEFGEGIDLIAELCSKITIEMLGCLACLTIECSEEHAEAVEKAFYELYTGDFPMDDPEWTEWFQEIE